VRRCGRVREADDSLKPGAQAPGIEENTNRAREAGGSCRPFHGLKSFVGWGSWGLRPRLYAVVRFADSQLQPVRFADSKPQTADKGRSVRFAD